MPAHAGHGGGVGSSFGFRPGNSETSSSAVQAGAEGYFPAIPAIRGIDAAHAHESESALTDEDDQDQEDTSAGRFVDLPASEHLAYEGSRTTTTGPPLLYAKPYFRILAKAAEGESGRSTPIPQPTQHGQEKLSSSAGGDDAQSQSQPTGNRTADGYYRRFFVEERRLGMGAEGSVFLCQHVLDGHQLGRYAVKKVAVGDSRPYLDRVLREVRLLESLRHPNIIPYHHVWIENAQFSR